LKSVSSPFPFSQTSHLGAAPPKKPDLSRHHLPRTTPPPSACLEPREVLLPSSQFCRSDPSPIETGGPPLPNIPVGAERSPWPRGCSSGPSAPPGLGRSHCHEIVTLLSPDLVRPFVTITCVSVTVEIQTRNVAVSDGDSDGDAGENEKVMLRQV